MKILARLLAILFLICGSAASSQTLRCIVPQQLADTVFPVILPESSSPHAVIVTARATAATSSSRWSIMLITGIDTVSVTLAIDPADRHNQFDRSKAIITVTKAGKQLGSASFTEGLATSPDEYNSLSIKADSTGLIVSGGHRRLTQLLSVPLKWPFMPRRIALGATGKVDVSELSVALIPPRESVAETSWTTDSIAAAIAGAAADSPVGYWEYLDRKTTPRKAREGGRYRLAIVKSVDRPGTFDILYLSGAAVEASSWKPGMRKGRLIPTDFIGHYDLEWIDATFVLRTRDIHASIDNESILTLSFPLFNSSLRFAKTLR